MLIRTIAPHFSEIMQRFTQRWLHSSSNPVPLCTFGWSGNDSRTASKITLGSALLDGNYQTYWEHFGVAQRAVLGASLAFIKGGNVPRGIRVPFVASGRVLLNYVYDSVSNSIECSNQLGQDNIFQRKYDLICPLPSSKGPATAPNIECANMLSKAFGGVPVEFVVNRHSPLPVKSTNTSAEIRQNKDAPRIMHYSTLSIEPSLMNCVKNKKILLYDDVITWGNVSEAARNLLLILGAAEVDVFCVFATDPTVHQKMYEFVGGNEKAEDVLCCSKMSPEYFRLTQNTILMKEILPWRDQKSYKEWNDVFGRWINEFHPEYVPNDIPF
jgi:hypothetical protein